MNKTHETMTFDIIFDTSTVVLMEEPRRKHFYKCVSISSPNKVYIYIYLYIFNMVMCVNQFQSIRADCSELLRKPISINTAGKINSRFR